MDDSVFAKNIEKYIPSYPSIEEDSDFSYQIARKKEFYDLKLYPEENVPDIPGTPLLSQELQKRFFSPETNFSSGLIYQGVGTGKCVLPNTFISTSKGELTSEQIWNRFSSDFKFLDNEGEWSKPIENILVNSFDKGKFIPKNINQLYRQYISEEIWDIVLDNGSKISLTKAHHLFNGEKWTNDFSIGGTICVPKILPSLTKLEKFQTLTDINLLYPKIKNISARYYEGFVYDFEVLETHNYVANNILCHNTCLSSLIIENFKNTLVGGEKRRPALVIVPNDVLADSYRNEVSNRCTKEGIYLPKFTEAELAKYEYDFGIEMSDITREKRLRAAIAKSYEIITYEKFFLKSETIEDISLDDGKTYKIWKMVKRLSDNPEFIRRRFNNRVIIIDEAHNFRIQPTKKKKHAKLQNMIKEEAGVPVELYNEMYRFLHTVENCRIIMLTGTPIWDTVDEISSLMNLILTKDEKLPTKKKFLKEFFDNEGNLIPEKAKILKDKFRGKVSYLRPMMTTAKRQEIGVTSPWLKKIIVFPSAMSQFQYEISKEIMEKVEKVDVSYITTAGNVVNISREMKGGALRLKARDAANFVFPKIEVTANGKYKITGSVEGEEVFNKYIETTNKGRSYRYKNNIIAKAIQENIDMFSCKFDAIINHIKQKPNELVFIYNEFVKSPGGVINMALVMQELGFVWAKSAIDIKKPGKKKRFAVITSNIATTHLPNQIKTLIESFNREDNKYGERCQIIIGSKKIGAGITLKNIRQVHDVMPHWNISSIDQAEGRAFRVGSHNDLPENERYINIYRHVAVQEFVPGENNEEYNTGMGFPKNSGFTDKETMDIYIYKTAERKDMYNTQIFRLLKEIAWDCPLTYKRNVLKGDQDFTRSCDYMKCNYKCDNFPEKYIKNEHNVWDYDIPQEEILRDTYNIFYSTEDVNNMIKRIKELFQVHFTLRLDLIADLLNIESEQEHDLLLKTLEIIINTKILIKDRLGFGVYLKEQGNNYFLDINVSYSANYPENTYINTPFITENNSLENIIEIEQLIEDKKYVQEFCIEPKNKSYLIDKMNYRTLIILLENIKSIEAKKPEERRTIKEKEAIEIIMKKLGENLVYMSDGKIIHNMYKSEYTGIGYNVAVQEIKPEGLIRVFNPDTFRWTYASPEEEEFFIVKIKEKKKQIRTDIWDNNQYGVYGFRDKSNKFKIRVKPQEGKETKGSVCMEVSWKINKLYELINKIGAMPIPSEDFKNISYEELYKDIKGQPALLLFINGSRKRSLEELQSIRTLYSMNKKQICAFLEQWFKDKGLYYTDVV